MHHIPLTGRSPSSWKRPAAAPGRSRPAGPHLFETQAAHIDKLESSNGINLTLGGGVIAGGRGVGHAQQRAAAPAPPANALFLGAVVHSRTQAAAQPISWAGARLAGM